MILSKIISGGQTGADRAGIDTAIECNIPYGGWIPKGRKAEDGPIPKRYTELEEMGFGSYPQRTLQNVLDSDGTLIFGYGTLTTGSALTRKLAIEHEKPYLHIDLNIVKYPEKYIIDWITKYQISVLNVAGRKASKAPQIYQTVKAILLKVIRELNKNETDDPQ